MNSSHDGGVRALPGRRGPPTVGTVGQSPEIAPLVAGALGLLVGLVSALAFRWSEHSSRRVPPQPVPDVDEGVARVLSVLRSAAVVVDGDGRVVRATAASHALGLVRDGALTHPALRDLVAQVRRDGVIQDAELDLPRGPMSTAALRVSVRVAAVTSQLVLVLADDLTQARRLEAIRRDFVVNVSHELKTPVGALALLAETVEGAADDPEAVRRFAARMQTEASRLSRLVQEIIELSRLQVAGALDEITLVDVDQVVAEAADSARTAADAKHIRLRVGGTGGLTVSGDRNLLVTAVRNLLDNAVAYSPEHTAVSVGVTQSGDVVEISVVDEGIGIEPSVQERVFERFYRVDPARSRDTGGTGLGLSIVKHVANDHGGDVTVWSQPGRGSTFTLRLPRAEGPPSAVPHPRPRDAVDEPLRSQA